MRKPKADFRKESAPQISKETSASTTSKEVRSAPRTIRNLHGIQVLFKEWLAEAELMFGQNFSEALCESVLVQIREFRVVLKQQSSNEIVSYFEALLMQNQILANGVRSQTCASPRWGEL